MNWVNAITKPAEQSSVSVEPSDDFIVFVPTSTPEKVASLQHAADTAGWPIHFRQMHDLVSAFHVPDEISASYQENAKGKLDESGDIIRRINDGEAWRVKNLCAKWNIKYQKDHILFATDDSGLDAPPGVWEKVDHTGIAQATLEKIDQYLAKPAPNGNSAPKGGAGTELAPVLSAMLGSAEYMRRMVDTITKNPAFNTAITDKNVEFIDRATLLPRKLSEEKQRDPLSAHTTLIFRDKPIPDSPIKTTYHYLHPKNIKEDRPQDAGKTAAELGWDYLGHYSPKREVVDRLAHEVLGLTDQDKRPRRKLADPDQSLRVSWVDFESVGDGHSPVNGHTHTFHRFGTSEDAKASPLAALTEIQSLMKQNDAFVLLPDSSKLKKIEDFDRFRKYYTLFSMIVAKQLIGEDMNKPVIIQNHDGCWDDAIAMHQSLVKRSVTKDFNFAPRREGLAPDEATTLQSNAYFDVISSGDLQAIQDRTMQLLDWHRERYEKRDPIKPVIKAPVTYAEGEEPPEGMYKVAVFLSAGNENIDLNNATKKFCHGLAMKGYGMVTGGGDRYAMGAAHEGYMDGQKALKIAEADKDQKTRTWSGAYSTDILLKAETKDGKLAKGFTYKKCCADIYKRMADMLETSDTVVVRVGGAGTVQEWMAFLILKHMFPEKMEGKNIIIYDPTVFKTDAEPFYEPVLRPVLGEDYDAIMGKKGDDAKSAASKKIGMYVADSDEKIMELIEGFEKASPAKTFLDRHMDERPDLAGGKPH